MLLSHAYATNSGVATLEQAGARTLATSGRALLIVVLLIANRALNGLEIERRSITMYKTELRVSYAHHMRVCCK